MVDKTNFSISPDNNTESFNVAPDDSEESFIVGFGEVTNIGGGGTSNFNNLTNRPKYDSTLMSGDTNIPKVPTQTSDLTNDSEFQTATEVNGAISEAISEIVIPTVNDGTLTINQNNANKGTFKANDSNDVTVELTDTTYSDFTGTDGQTAGSAGLVPAPTTADTDKFLKSDGTWDTAGGGVTPVQTTGTSETDVMSQNAVTSMVFADPATCEKVKIGAGASVSAHSYNMAIGHNASANGTESTAIGESAKARGSGTAIGRNAQAGTATAHSSSVAIGDNSYVGGDHDTAVGASSNVINSYSTAVGNSARARSERSLALGASATVENSPAMAYSVALGANSVTTRAGEVNIGTGVNNYGYNSTPYRVIGGVYDGQLAQDAATVSQVNATIDAINAALSTNIPHIGA